MKGLERFLGTVETQTHELMETSSGEAKYEHQHKAIVWRVPRLPKLGQGMTFFYNIIEKVEINPSFFSVHIPLQKNYCPLIFFLKYTSTFQDPTPIMNLFANFN